MESMFLCVNYVNLHISLGIIAYCLQIENTNQRILLDKLSFLLTFFSFLTYQNLSYTSLSTNNEVFISSMMWFQYVQY